MIRLLRAIAVGIAVGVALAAVPAALAAAVLTSSMPTEHKLGAVWFLACVVFVALAAATVVAVSRTRARRQEARRTVRDALLPLLADDTRPRRHPVFGSRQPRPGALYVKSTRAADDTAQLPAVPTTAPDFSPAGGWDNPREARALHHQVYDVVGDPALQTLLDQIDDLTGIDDERREWLRAQALHGVPARTLLDASWWAAVDRRRKPRPKPKPYPNGGR